VALAVILYLLHKGSRGHEKIRCGLIWVYLYETDCSTKADNGHQEIRQRNIELWSNVYETEFALCLPIPDSADVIRPEELLFLARTERTTSVPA
jgi:hypothetical protein